MSVVYVVMAVHNRRDYTRTCLSQLQRQTYEPIRTVVVDDGSTDGTGEMIRAEFPGVDYLATSGSLYWTGSMRAGIERVLRICRDDDYLLVLNDDLLFDQMLVETLMATSRTRPGALIHACNVFDDAPDRVEFGGVKVNWWTAESVWINRGRSLREFPRDHVESSSCVWGRGLLVPINTLRDIGNFDGRYEQNGDSEFGRRAALAGYDLIVAYGAVTRMHRKGVNSAVFGASSYHLGDWRRYFFGVHSGARLKTILLNARLMTQSRWQAFSYGVFSYARFLWHFLRRLDVLPAWTRRRRKRGSDGGVSA